MASSKKYSYNLCGDKEEEMSIIETPTSNKVAHLLSPHVEIVKTVMSRLFTSPVPIPKPSLNLDASSNLNETIDLTSSSLCGSPAKIARDDEDDYSILFLTPGSKEEMSSGNGSSNNCNPSDDSILHRINPAFRIGANFYEKQLEAENQQLKQFLTEVLPSSETPQDDVIALYKSRNANLLLALKEAETNKTVCMIARDENEAYLKERIAKLEEEITATHREHELEMEQIVRGNQALIQEIINSQLEEIEKWKTEFQRDCKMKGDGKRGSVDLLMDYEIIAIPPCGNDSIPLQLLQQFRELSPTAQGIMAAGIGAVVLVVGYYSWPFISWAWPRLSSFATRVEVATVGAWIYTFINSNAYKDFIRAWEQGKPFTPVLIKQFGPEVVRHITKLAPRLLRFSSTALVKN